MKKGILITACLVIILLMVLSAPAMAQRRNLKVIQGIALESVYDDNIYLANGSVENEKQDWITHVKPTIGLDFTFIGRGELALGYRGDFAYYKDNHRNDWQNHTGFFNLNYEAPSGLILGIDNTYTDAEDPFGSESQYKLGVPNTERWNHNLKGKIGYGLGKGFKIMAFYNYYKQAYDLEEDRTQDYKSNEYGCGVWMRLLPKTWGFVRYHFGHRDYFSHPASAGTSESNDADFQWQRLNAGFTWEASAKIGGELDFGYLWKDYDNDLDPNGDKYEDMSTWIAETGVNLKLTAEPFSLTITRALRDSGSDTHEYYEDTGVGLSLTKTLATKLKLSLSGMYSKNVYNKPANKEQDNYLASIGLNHQIKSWLSAGVRYTYTRKDSNYAQDEFTDNQFMISISALYPASRKALF